MGGFVSCSSGHVGRIVRPPFFVTSWSLHDIQRDFVTDRWTLYFNETNWQTITMPFWTNGLCNRLTNTAFQQNKRTDNNYAFSTCTILVISHFSSTPHPLTNHPTTNAFIHLSSPTHSSSLSLIHSLIHLIVYSFIHWFNYSFIHSPTFSISPMRINGDFFS